MSPPSQKNRRIGFHLTGGQGADQDFYLTLRPQDLSYSRPSRLAVQQTLGGAWMDAFDRGIASVRLNGHCGWRGSFLLSGEDAFAALQTIVFDAWHDRRQACLDAGTDPGQVELVYTDDLDQIDLLVAPRSFMLRRSKSSPLLMNFSIDLLSLGPAGGAKSLIDEIISALSNPLRWLAGVTGLGGTLGQLQTIYSDATALYGAASGAVQNLIGTGIGLFQQVQSVAQDAQGLFIGGNASLLSAALLYSQASANGLAALAPDPTLPADQLIMAASLPGLFNEAYCNMANSFTSDAEIAIYDAMLGASSCSSTGGGDPASVFVTSGTNPFDSLFPDGSTPVSITAPALAALGALQGDPLILLQQQSQIAGAMAAAAAGVTVAPLSQSITPTASSGALISTATGTVPTFDGANGWNGASGWGTATWS